MANYKRGHPRTKDRGMSDYKHMARRRGGDHNLDRLYDSCPSGWNTLFHIRPTRREVRRLERAVLKGADPEGIAWPLPGKPHVYYW